MNQSAVTTHAIKSHLLVRQHRAALKLGQVGPEETVAGAIVVVAVAKETVARAIVVMVTEVCVARAIVVSD